MAEDVVFWIAAPVMVVASLGMLFAKKAVHVAMAVVLVMVGLSFLYFSLNAPFLGIVQIVVYTGAVMMLFLFVLMLVGVDQAESLKETIKGQRFIAVLAAGGIATLLITAVSRAVVDFPGATKASAGDNPQLIADQLFSRFVLLMEVLGVLLITAAVGALILTHVPRLRPRRSQKEIQAARIAAGADPVNKPMPGVYARRNALDVPALDPQGKPIPESISRVLKARHQNREADQLGATAEEEES